MNFKAERSKKLQMLAKMKFMSNMSAFKGFGRCTFIEIILKKILLIKELFINDIENGDEVAIPKELKQPSLSFQYKFYDPLLPIVKDSVSKDIRDFYNLKSQLNLNRYHDNSNLFGKMIEMMKLDSVLDTNNQMKSPFYARDLTTF